MTEQQSRRIEALYLEMYDKLMAYARANEDSEALAEEAVQETFRVACQYPEKLCSSPNPQGWLVLALRNTIRNMRSSRANARRIVERYLLAHVTEMTFSEDRVDLNVMYANIADMEEFQLLREMAIEGRSHEEMARARGISINACKKRVQRAKETLQRKIEKDVTK